MLSGHYLSGGDYVNKVDKLHVCPADIFEIKTCLEILKRRL